VRPACADVSVHRIVPDVATGADESTHTADTAPRSSVRSTLYDTTASPTVEAGHDSVTPPDTTVAVTTLAVAGANRAATRDAERGGGES
jgi:hypothetical protein